MTKADRLMVLTLDVRDFVLQTTREDFEGPLAKSFLDDYADLRRRLIAAASDARDEEALEIEVQHEP